MLFPVCNSAFPHANAQPLCQVSYSHIFGMWHQLNLSCASHDDQMNGVTAAFSINPAKWPYSKGLKYFFSVQNSDKHVSSKNGDSFIILPTLNAFLRSRLLNNTSALFSQLNYSSWSHVPVSGKTLVL